MAGEAADPQAPLLGEWETVKPPLADAWVGNVEKPSCCGQRGLLGLLRGKSRYVHGENECQTPLKNWPIYYVVIYTHYTTWGL